MARTPVLPNTAASAGATAIGSTQQPPESAAAPTSAKQSTATVNFSTTTETIPENANTTPADNNDSNSNNDQQEPPFELYKSSRLKGYITLILASIINFMAARSSGETVNSTNAVSSTESQRAYAEAAGLTSFLVCFFTFCAHLDRWSPLKAIWVLVFKDGSKFELLLIVFIVIWWTVATAVQTTVQGIAGDGKGQYNLYYSTWGCCWTAYWTLEKWLVAYGWASFKAFISSWPFRAPGWIAICGFSFMTLMWYLDLFSNHEAAAAENSALDRHFDEVKLGQWQWLIFVGAITLFPSMLFVVIELFRETSAEDHQANESGNQRGGGSRMGDINGRMSFAVTASAQGATSPGRPGLSPMRSSRQFTPQRSNPLPEKGMSTGGKGQYENILEGFCLALLVCLWIPTVIVATTPGGGASLVGNAYFFTWVTTIFVMETFIWFVHDLRKGVHSALQVKEREYHKRQQEVLEKSRALQGKRALRLGGGVYDDTEDDDMVVDESVMRHMRPALPAHVVPDPQPLHNHPVFDLSDDDGTHNIDRQGHEEPTPIIANVQAARQPRLRGRRLRGSDDDSDNNDDDDDDRLEGPPYFSRPKAGSPAGSSVFFDTQMSVEEQEDEQHIDPIG